MATKKVYHFTHLFSTVIYLFCIVLFSHCSENNKRLIAAKEWYSTTKTEILRQSAQHPTDSILRVFNKDKTFRRDHFFHCGREFATKGYDGNGSVLRLEVYFSNDRRFELRRELCVSGQCRFEGIFYKDKAYGPAQDYFCNGQMSCQDIRFRGEQIGLWQTWDEEGRLTEQIDYKQLEKIDSLPVIEKN